MTPAAPLFLLAALALTACGDPAEAARPSTWSEPVPPACPPGEWDAGEGCGPAATVFSPTGATLFVDRASPAASDRGPGTEARPFRTISRAAEAVRPGDAVVIRAGVYRESIRPRIGGSSSRSRVTFAAYPGETVVVSGADVADSGWTRTAGGDWRLPWAYGPLRTYSDDPAFRREMLVVGGRVQRPVAGRAELAPGRFLREGSDNAPTALVARLPLARSGDGGIEVGVRTRLFWPSGPDDSADCGDPSTPGWFRVVGLTFRYATNRAQWGAVCAGSVGGLFEDVTVEWTNGRGIDVSGREHTFRRTRADLNGQIGWGGACASCLFDETAAVGNNWKGHDPYWEAGGGKWHHTTDTVFRRHYSAHNDGPGIWLDGDNTSNTIEGALSVSDQVAGIMLELRTTGTLVQHSVVARTRWRAWSGSGVLSQAASRNVFSHNTFTENGGTGLWLRRDPDRRASDGDNLVANNWIVDNAASGEEAREVQVEADTPAMIRSTRFVSNVYGRLGDGLYRSTFFARPVPALAADFRSEDVLEWARITGAEQDRLVGRARLVATRIDGAGAGARAAGLVPSDRVGADPARVRARGDWNQAPPRPAWPR
ncbi:NosD domain-containing protein [Rubrivirga sp. IMCC43871]|uniref:NosD domain-containing protein n=1 Tax=Rubrivirga sp. IMCC43871 TaxID=3391575 RepID=UPI00398FC425